MSVYLYDENRQQVIDLLPTGWAKKFETPENKGETVYEGEDVVYSGTDKEALDILEAYGLLTGEISGLLTQE